MVGERGMDGLTCLISALLIRQWPQWDHGLAIPWHHILVACVDLTGEFVGVVDLGQGVIPPGPVSIASPPLRGSCLGCTLTRQQRLARPLRSGSHSTLSVQQGSTSLSLRPLGCSQRRAGSCRSSCDLLSRTGLGEGRSHFSAQLC